MEQNGKYKLTTEHRLTALETLLKKISTNDLPHIHRRLNWVVGMIFTMLIAVLAAVISLVI